MDALLILIVSFAPGLLWLLYFYRRDIYEPEPAHLVARSFVFGVLAVIPVGLIEAPFQLLIERPSGVLEFLAVSIVVIGLTEESAKFLAAKLAVFDKAEIDEVVDGIIYGVSAGLGFSAAENYLYVAAFGLRVGLVRCHHLPSSRLLFGDRRLLLWKGRDRAQERALDSREGIGVCGSAARLV